MMNTILAIVVIVLFVAIVGAMYFFSKREENDDPERDKLTFAVALEIIKSELADLVKSNNVSGIVGVEYAAAVKRRSKIRKAMKDCVFGIDGAKIIVIEQIKRVISEICEEEEEFLEIENLKGDYIDPRIKFEILMHFYKKEFGRDALEKFIEKYKLARGRFEIEDKSQISYIITKQDIDTIFEQEARQLTKQDIAHIIATLLFQAYKGFGIIDTIREMNINGISLGVSGSILSAILPTKGSTKHTSTRCVWLYYKGKEVHLEFLSFSSSDEILRIVSLIGRYGTTRPLTIKNPYKITTMYDQSRVLATRPPVSDSPAVFIRKFSLPNVSLPFLLIPKDKDDIPIIKRADLPMGIMRYVMQGQITIVITGMQGTGKTTQLMAIIKYISPELAIRTIETTFELSLRELYPQRNILATSETEYVDAKAIQDFLKKSNAGVTILGEIATDEVCARFIQNTQISSPFSIASHHAMTPTGLVNGMGLSMVACKAVQDVNAAKIQVIKGIPFNGHLAFINHNDMRIRFYDHVTEIIPVESFKDLPALDFKDEFSLLKSKAVLDREVTIRQMNPELFTTNQLITFDRNRLEYVPLNWMSKYQTERIISNLNKKAQGEFIEFVEKNWFTDKGRYKAS